MGGGATGWAVRGTCYDELCCRHHFGGDGVQLLLDPTLLRICNGARVFNTCILWKSRHNL